LALRNTLPSIARGSYEHATVEGSVMSYQRRFDSDHVVVVINFGTTDATISTGELPPGALLAAVYPARTPNAAVGSDGNTQINIGAQSVRVFSVRR
jgi:hypothetical protein